MEVHAMDETAVSGDRDHREDQRGHGDRLVWSVEEAGRMLGISRAHAYELVARGELPHLRLGRRVVVPKHVIEQLLASVTAGQ
jgi:excisionase family DNA binding protein